jgi:hypothetical protein
MLNTTLLTETRRPLVLAPCRGTPATESAITTCSSTLRSDGAATTGSSCARWEGGWEEAEEDFFRRVEERKAAVSSKRRWRKIFYGCE